MKPTRPDPPPAQALILDTSLHLAPFTTYHENHKVTLKKYVAQGPGKRKIMNDRKWENEILIIGYSNFVSLNSFVFIFFFLVSISNSVLECMFIQISTGKVKKSYYA